MMALSQMLTYTTGPGRPANPIRGNLMMQFICKTCGTQFPASEQPLSNCPICEDERQYIGWEGQQWTTLSELQQNHHNIIKTIEPNLTGIGTRPSFAIAQRALLVQTSEGNILWDCISLIDEPTSAAVKALGGVSAIAISHPHFYSSMIEWSRAFNAPIYLHADDRQWVMRQDPQIKFWEGETKSLGEELMLLRLGGHFTGGTVLHWSAGADGKGAILSGDILQVVSDRRFVSFMYSFPNLIPLPAHIVRRIANTVKPYEFDRIYGAWWDRIITSGAKAAVALSAERYITALQQ